MSRSYQRSGAYSNEGQNWVSLRRLFQSLHKRVYLLTAEVSSHLISNHHDSRYLLLHPFRYIKTLLVGRLLLGCGGEGTEELG